MTPPDLWQSRLAAASENPGKEGWLEIIRVGREVLRRGRPEEVSAFVRVLQGRLETWPAELDRHVPASWPPAWKVLEKRVKETDTILTPAGRMSVYEAYEVYVCGDPRLRTVTGRQAVRLRRRFVGAARSFSRGTPMKIGQKGDPDLQGGVVIDLRTGPLEAVLEVEVKTPEGYLKEEQEERRDAVTARGGVHVVCCTINECVVAIVAARERLTLLLGG